MKVLYDHQIFSVQRYGGISRYFYELVREFNNIQDVDCEIPLLLSNNYYISDKKVTNHVNLLSNKQFFGKQRLFNYLNKSNTIFEIKQQKFDIFHPTYYDPYFLKYIGEKPFVLTIYDMIHERYNELFSRNDKTIQYKKQLLSRASKIIAISESTKKDIIELLGIDKSKIEVIYLGNSMLPIPNKDLNFRLPKNYILFVGSRRGYKNFERFINSIAELLQENKEIFIVCAGGGRFDFVEKILFEKLKILKQIIQYNVDDTLLAYLYQNAQCFVFPSLYEGFGIPILESFACGCPLICSNTSSLPEIAREGALYCDPTNEDSIKNAIKKVLNDKQLAEKLIIKGYQRLQEFSWQRTAIETKKVYESIFYGNI